MDIPVGDITIGDAYQLLPFANTLVNVRITGAELLAVLEEVLDYALHLDGSSGAYPYASGLRWDVNLSQPAGRRFSNVPVKLKHENQWSAIDPEHTYVVVTSDYLASGKDGYRTFAALSSDLAKIEETFLDYAQSFVDYVKLVGAVERPAVSDYSTQAFYDANGDLQR